MMKIKTRQDQEIKVEKRKEEHEEDEEPLTPTGRLFHAPGFNCYIMSVIGLKSKIKPDVFIEGIKQTLIKHPRFSSIMVNNDKQEQKWVRTKVVVEDHIIIPKIQTQNTETANADAFLESYFSDLTTIPLDTSKPLWELHILDLKTSDAENVLVLKMHHSIGDGMSLMSLVLACTRKTSNQDELPGLPNKNRSMSGSRGDSRLLWLVMVMWSMVMLVFNTVCDALKFIGTTMFLKDSETPIKGDYRLVKSKRMCLVHRLISFEDIKLIKNAMKMTVNDVLLGVSQAALSQYLETRYGEEKKKKNVGEQEESKINTCNIPKGIKLRACLLVNTRPTTGVQDLANMMAKGSKCRWGNCIGYILFPFSIQLRDDPLEHLRIVKSNIEKKKNSLEASLTLASTKILVKLLGVLRAANLTRRTISNTTMSFSNLVGPIEEVSLYGHPITYIAPSAYGHPHALTMHFQSYMNKMIISLTYDPTVISDPYRLCDDLEESLNSIKTAVQERGST